MRKEESSGRLTFGYAILGLFLLFCPAAFAQDEGPGPAAKPYVPPRACVAAFPSEGQIPFIVHLINCSTGDYDTCTASFLATTTNCLNQPAILFRKVEAGKALITLTVSNSKHPGSASTDTETITGRKPGEPPSGYWPTTQAAMFASSSDLELFRQYRNEYLKKTKQGKLYVSLLYENSEQALKVFERNPDLIAKAKLLIEANTGAVGQSLNGQRGEINNTEEIAAFLEEFGEKSPATLKVLCKMVRRDMLRKHKSGKPFLGFEMK